MFDFHARYILLTNIGVNMVLTFLDAAAQLSGPLFPFDLQTGLLDPDVDQP